MERISRFEMWQLYNSIFLWYTFYGTILSGSVQTSRVPGIERHEAGSASSRSAFSECVLQAPRA